MSVLDPLFSFALDEMKDMVKKLVAERDALRAENAALKDILASLAAENAALKAKHAEEGS